MARKPASRKKAAQRKDSREAPPSEAQPHLDVDNIEHAPGNSQHQDPQRRLGQFEGAGEHPRTGQRNK